jgi:hypothetical protein
MWGAQAAVFGHINQIEANEMMKKKPNDSEEIIRETLLQHILQSELIALIDSDMVHLVPDDNPSRNQNILADGDKIGMHDVRDAQGARWCRRLSTILNSRSDWFHLAASHFGLQRGVFGAGTGAFANTGSAGAKHAHSAQTNFRSWRQGDLHLTLGCETKPPFQVNLHINEGPDAQILRLCWIDETSLSGDVSLPPSLVEFKVERIADRTYRVKMSVGAFSTRLRAINAYEENKGEDAKDPRLLLPFVEME